MSLQGAIEWIQDQALTLSGMGAAPDNLSELAGSSLMFCLVYPASGEITTAAANWGRDFDNIVCLILTGRTDLNEAMQRLEGYPHNLATLIKKDVTLGANVSTFENMTYQFTNTDVNGVACVGYSLTVNRVKTLTTF